MNEAETRAELIDPALKAAGCAKADTQEVTEGVGQAKDGARARWGHTLTIDIFL